MATRVVNVKKEPYDVYIGRPSNLQNPYHIGADGTREDVIEKHREYVFARIAREPKFLDDILALKDKTIGCFCEPLACHGDLYVWICDEANLFSDLRVQWIGRTKLS